MQRYYKDCFDGSVVVTYAVCTENERKRIKTVFQNIDVMYCVSSSGMLTVFDGKGRARSKGVRLE
jgi:hypothetical protein